MTNSISKCGEITFCTQVDKRVYVLNCLYCPQICIQLEMFINHLEQEHAKNLTLDNIVQPEIIKMPIEVELQEVDTEECAPHINGRRHKMPVESILSEDPLESEYSTSEICVQSTIKIEQEEECSQILFNMFATEENSSEGIFSLNPKQVEKEANDKSGLNYETIKELSIRSILLQTVQGAEIIEAYSKKKILNADDRTFIVHKVIQFYLDNDLKLNVKKCEEIAEDILELFPSETLETYFLQSSKRRPPKGKLWDRFQGRKRLMKKLSLKRSFEGQDEYQINGKIAKTENYEKLRTELKYIRDVEQILKKWRETVSYRTEQIKSLPFSETMKLWPLYKSKQSCFTLIKMDFEYLYPAKTMLYDKWKRFMEVFEYPFRERIKDSNSLNMFTNFIQKRSSMDTDNCNVYIMKILHAILIPNQKVVNKQFVKFTIKDSQQTFCTEIFDINRLHHNESKPEPYIVVVGKAFKYTKFYVVLNGSKFRLCSFMEAVEFCFKLLKLFNFDNQNELFWMFVSKYLFDIEPNLKSSTLSAFLKDINNMQTADLS